MSEATRIFALGNALAAQGRIEEAIAHYRRALGLNPGFPDAHTNLANALRVLGSNEQAIAHFERALELKPNQASVHNNCANALRVLGRQDKAIGHYERALAIQPDYVEAHHNLGLALAACGDLGRAIAHYQRAVTLAPDFVEGHYNLGNALWAQGQNEQAIAHFERVLVLRPSSGQAHNSLGNVRWAQRHFNEAASHYERALALMPEYADAHNNLGLTLATRRSEGDLDRARVHYERALALRPEFAQTYYNLGNLLSDQGNLEGAVAKFEKTLELKPDYADAHSNLGAALCVLGMVGQSAIHCERALVLRPDDALAHNNFAQALWLQGSNEQAIAHYQRAMALQPDYVEAHSNLLMALNYLSGNDPVAVYKAHRDYAAKRESPLAAFRPVLAVDRSPSRRLRVGYVSADYRQHSVAFFLEPLLSNHDHDRFEIFCYSNHQQEDEVTKRLRRHADHWRHIARVPDDVVAEQIRTDRIDILVDLSGHTAHNRLLVFARRPAPIQVTWLGYPNTTGLSAMDYRITDSFADPVGMTEDFHSETLIRLPESFSCYQPPADAPEVSRLPAFEKGYVRFGSFNNLAKITPEVMEVWARILKAVPDSRLTLKNLNLREPAIQENVRNAFFRLGIAPDRLEVLGPDKSATVHLERYASIDIGLDPFPYNGATTTCEALWMGVPVVVLAGRTHAGRVGVSQLSNLGYVDLVAQSVEEYVTIASTVAADLERLSTLRAVLRKRVAASPLTNAPRFAQNLEQAYLSMWKKWVTEMQSGG